VGTEPVEDSAVQPSVSERESTTGILTPLTALALRVLLFVCGKLPAWQRIVNMESTIRLSIPPIPM
jgi:hypothetical protein